MRHTSLREKLNDAAGWVMAGCGLIATIVITAALTSPENGIAAGILLIGILTGGFTATAVHEAGHALAAHLVGWRVWIVSVFGVVHRRDHGVRLSTHYSHDAGGYVLASPPSDAYDSKWRSIIFSAGGPLASLLTGPPVVALMLYLPPGPWRETPIGEALVASALAFGIASCVAALATLWPFRDKDARPNDMQMILATAFTRDPSVDVRGVSWAWGLFDYGIEPSAWPRWMHESIARSANNPWAPPAVSLLTFFCALPVGDDATARTAAQRNTHPTGKLMRAYVHAFFDGDADAAENEIKHLVIPPNEAALALLGDFIDARIAALRNDPRGLRARAQIAERLRTDIPKPYWIEVLARTSQLTASAQ